jgi:hypothetical protein
MTREMKQNHFVQAVIIWVVTHCSLLGYNQLLTAHKSKQRRSPHYHNPCNNQTFDNLEYYEVNEILATCYKGKAVPQHTYGGAGGRGCIAPNHSRPRK